jgi:hypothetical protein
MEARYFFFAHVICNRNLQVDLFVHVVGIDEQVRNSIVSRMCENERLNLFVEGLMQTAGSHGPVSWSLATCASVSKGKIAFCRTQQARTTSKYMRTKFGKNENMVVYIKTRSRKALG